MIDTSTVEKIKEAANIVEVVSEFVTLRKRGANFQGLCPFHEERTPSFYVSPARGTCHCFGCGRGGTPVGFIMEHEQLSYPEALKWLARKYNIEVKERELTDEQRREQNERESMFIVNEWAASYFHEILQKEEANTLNIGKEYFRSRGFRDDIISKFMLGYDPSDRRALVQIAVRKGYKEEFILKTGLCYKRDDGSLIDRFSGRVIFPWVGISGKIVGFGGRLLDARTKGVEQKYVNSSDSEIYHKDHELYGLYQAKRAIAKEDLVYMVEGYTDVISMHQCGIENVVANSGTALSKHQINVLHRFTSNIILLYDGDSAGQHATLRGTDLILAEGMNLKVLNLPEGEDPDSFSKKMSATEFKNYIAENQKDFIQYKTSLLIDGVTDPTRRSEGISSIVKSISVIPNQILRETYLQDCSLKLGVAEGILLAEMNKYIMNARGNSAANNISQPQRNKVVQQMTKPDFSARQKIERMIARLLIKDGDKVIYNNIEDEDGNVHNLTVAQYIEYDLSTDSLELEDPLISKILHECSEKGKSLDFKAESYFIHHNDIDISKLAMGLSLDTSEMLRSQNMENTNNSDDETEHKKQIDAVRQRTEHLMLDFRKEYIETQLSILQQQIAKPDNSSEELMSLMSQYRDMQMIRNEIARKLGTEIIL